MTDLDGVRARRSRSTFGRRVRAHPATFAALALAGVLAACSSGAVNGTPAGQSSAPASAASGSPVVSSPAASGMSAADLVAQALQPPSWQGPTTPVTVSNVKGKSVFLINLVEAIPALHRWSSVTKAQLDALGVNTRICDGQGTPEGITSCLQQALGAKPDVIIALALDTDLIKSFISQANTAGIKVITGQTGVPGTTNGSGAVAEVSFDYPAVGRMLADWYATDSQCASAPQIITTTSSRQPSAAEVSGMQAEIARLCPGLQLPSVQNVLIPDWGTKLPTLTRSLLNANSNLEYLLPLYDGMTIPMLPAIQQLNLTRTIKVASFNATPEVMKADLASKTPLVADVGGPNDWYGYALADETLRVLAGDPVVTNENVPLRLFTAANLGTIDLNADESRWYGSVNYACNYKQLWGESC